MTQYNIILNLICEFLHKVIKCKRQVFPHGLSSYIVDHEDYF